MDNKAIASILYETADLMEIAGEDSFRIRSYRNAAESIEALPNQVADLIGEPKKLLEVPGIGKGMLANLKEIFDEGELRLHAQLIEKYRPSMLELLKIQGLGPKTVNLIWTNFQVSDVTGVEQLAREGKLRALPRMSEKIEQKILKAIQTYRSITGRFYLDEADRTAQKLMEHVGQLAGVEKMTPAGSLRRGRETVGDLDLLITGPCCSDPAQRNALVERILQFPGIVDVLARGENKVSFKLRSGMQIDVRILPPESFGAALQYFTGSKAHNVALRQRALKQGYTLNEYGLFTLPANEVRSSSTQPPQAGELPSPDAQLAHADELSLPAPSPQGSLVASATEEEIYGKLGLDWIPPELRENCGELEAAERHALPQLVRTEDIRGELHMHTVETDGRCTIEEMAVAARERGYQYIAITEHSKNLAFANGLDEKRTEEHMRRIRRASEQIDGISILAGIEVDILPDGALDLADSALAQLDVVIASVHSAFNQEPAQMTGRLLRALENRHVHLIGHPTGRLLLRRDAYRFDLDAVLKAAATRKVAMELNAYPDRLDLCDAHLRLARERGVKIIINTDAHHTSHFEKLKYGVLQARRAWLTCSDVLNTLPLEGLKAALKKG
ncbi:MAG: PHP domain-containing protein [Candidatus Korobacteraceae bacterium]